MPQNESPFGHLRLSITFDQLQRLLNVTGSDHPIDDHNHSPFWTELERLYLEWFVSRVCNPNPLRVELSRKARSQLLPHGEVSSLDSGFRQMVVHISKYLCRQNDLGKLHTITDVNEALITLLEEHIAKAIKKDHQTRWLSFLEGYVLAVETFTAVYLPIDATVLTRCKELRQQLQQKREALA